MMNVKTDLVSKISAVALMLALAACSSTDTSTGGGSSADNATSGSGSASASGVGSSSGIDASDVGASADSASGADAALGNILYFEFDSSTLTAEARGTLDQHAMRLKNSNGAIRLEGHADERGTREYNMALAERRAKVVESYLAVQGVSKSRMETIGYGEEKLAHDGKEDEHHSMNRRVELVE